MAFLAKYHSLASVMLYISPIMLTKEHVKSDRFSTLSGSSISPWTGGKSEGKVHSFHTDKGQP